MQSLCWQSPGDSGGDTALDSTGSHGGSDPDAATWTMQDPSASLEGDQGARSPRGRAQPLADNGKAPNSYDSMRLAELQACCGKNHGNSITTRKKDIGGLWKTKPKQEFILQLKDAATKSSKSAMLQSKMDRFLKPLAEKKPSDPIVL